jgi:2,4-dienoyl-CoA reductase-like NADH-dependent reductase (Old Yellow Enzyme family)
MMNIKELNELNHARTLYPKLFSPIKIGNFELANKTVFPPWGLNYCTQDGDFTAKLINFYEGLAKGGCALIITGASAISEDCVCPGGKAYYMRLYDDKWIAPHKRLFQIIQSYGSLAGLQLAHPGRQHPFPPYGHDALLAPSAIPVQKFLKQNPNYKVKAMTIAQIEQCIQNFIDTAIRAYKAGVDYIEFHAANGYLINQFLSPHTNIRKDEYGGSIENRTRFLVKVIKETKKIIGNSILIGARLAITEFFEDGLKPEHYREICPILEEAGLDIINGSVGNPHEHLEINVPLEKYGDMPNIDIIATIKKYTKLPVINVGSIMNCKNAENILNNGKADLIALGRSLMADPNLLRLSAEGKEESVRKCLRCNFCIKTKREHMVCCKVNPDYYEEEN